MAWTKAAIILKYYTKAKPMNKIYKVYASDFDDVNSILGASSKTATTQESQKGPFKAEEYIYRETTARFEQPEPNIRHAKIDKAYGVDPTSVEARKSRTRKESRTAFGRFIMEKFAEDYSEFAGKVNFEAIVEAANISLDLKKWYASRRNEWANMVLFPDWAVRKIDPKDFEIVQTKMAQVSNVRREKAKMDANIAKHADSLSKRVEQNALMKLKEIHKTDKGDTDWLAIVFTLTVENLPLERVLDIVRYRISDASKSVKEIEAEGYLTPNMYEDKVLDDFKKECFMHWQSGKSLDDYFKTSKVNLAKYDQSQGDGDLSDIREIVLGESIGKD